MKPIIEDQYTAARAYFLCVIGMLLFESLLQLPQYFLILRNRGRPFIKSSSSHSILYTYIHKLSTLPSFVPFLTNHRLPNLLRLAVFTALNFIWGWNRFKYTTDYKLYGWLTISNAGLGLLLSARSNLFSHILRIPTTTLLTYHRWIGRATIIHATIHFALNTQHNIRTSQIHTVFRNSRIQIGIFAWLSLCIIFITSLSFIRRRFFEIFYYTHFLFLVFVVGACIHAAHGPEFLLPGLGLWVIDRGIRFSYNFRKVHVKSVTVFEESNLTKLRIGEVGIREPGQMVWMQVKGVSWLEWHPFSVACAPGEGIVIAIRGLGGYTRRVKKVAGESAAALDGEGESEMSTGLKVRIDGPYGVGGTRWGVHPVTVLVAGGIGITPGISIASHIIHRAVDSAQNNGDGMRGGDVKRHIHLLWIVRDRKHIAWFMEELREMANIVKDHTDITLDITIHVTGSSGTLMEDSSIELKDRSETETAQFGCQDLEKVIKHGRPDITAWFADVKARRKGLDTVVNACGPRALISATRIAAAKVSWKDGLFHVEEEVFDL